VRQLAANDVRAIHEFEVWLKTVGVTARDKKPAGSEELGGRPGPMTQLCDAAFEASFHRSLRRREPTVPSEPVAPTTSGEVQAGLNELRAEFQAELVALREGPDEIAKLRAELDQLRQRPDEIARLRAEVEDLRREHAVAQGELAEHRSREEQRRATLFANQRALGKAIRTIADNTEGIAGNLREVESAVHAWQDGCSAKLVGFLNAIVSLSRGLRSVKEQVVTRSADPPPADDRADMGAPPILMDYADPVDRNPPQEHSLYDDDVELDPSG